jgi:hypothetical protein
MKAKVSQRAFDPIRRPDGLAPKRAAVLDSGALGSTPNLALRDDGRGGFSFTLANRVFPLADWCHDRRRWRRRRTPQIGRERLSGLYNTQS